MLYGGKDGRGLQAQYVVLDSDGDRLVPTHSLAPTHIGGPMAGLKPLGHSFYFPGGKPASASFCWFSPDQACSEGAFTGLQTLWELSMSIPSAVGSVVSFTSCISTIPTVRHLKLDKCRRNLGTYFKT